MRAKKEKKRLKYTTPAKNLINKYIHTHTGKNVKQLKTHRHSWKLAHGCTNLLSCRLVRSFDRSFSSDVLAP